MKPSKKVTNKFDTQLTAYCDESYNDAIYEYDTWIDECDIEGVIRTIQGKSLSISDETPLDLLNDILRSDVEKFAKIFRDLIKGGSNV